MGLEGHRLDVEAGPLGVEAGEVALGMAERRRRLDVYRGGRRIVLVERPRLVVDRQVAKGPGLRVRVLEDGPATRLDEQHLARPEPITPDRLRSGQGHRAG